MLRVIILSVIAAMVVSTARADALSDCDQQQDADLAVAGCTQRIDQAGTPAERARAHANRGRAYGGKGQYEQAIRDLDKAIELNPQDAGAHATRGRVYLATGKHDDAIRDLDQAIAFDPRDATVYLSRGMVFAAKGLRDRAVQDYDRVIELDPNDVYAAIAFEKKMKILNQDLDKAIELNPRDPLAWRHRGARYHYGKNHLDRALRDLTKAIELNPRDFWSFGYRGDVYSLMKQYDAAIQNYDKAIELNPRLARPAYTYRGIAYIAKGDYDRAIADFTSAIDIDPSGDLAYQRRAWAYFKAGRAAQGLPDAERSLQLRADSADALNTRGHILEALGRQEEAIADFRRALLRNPNLRDSAEGLKRLGAAP
jgi:tetratricopeptide (TPR) repeat protein